MKVLMVERSLQGIGMDGLGAAQRAAIDKASELTNRGDPIAYIRTTFVPADGRCMCLFDARDKATVERLNDEAGIPYDRVIEALDLK